MTQCLYPRILGATFATLPRTVREAHQSATVMRGTVDGTATPRKPDRSDDLPLWGHPFAARISCAA